MLRVGRRWSTGIGTSPGQYGVGWRDVPRRWSAGIGTSPGQCSFGLGFEFLQVFEGAVDGEAGSVEAVLEAGERLIAELEGLSGLEVGVRPVGFLGGEFPEVGIGAVEAAKGPLTARGCTPERSCTGDKS